MVLAAVGDAAMAPTLRQEAPTARDALPRLTTDAALATSSPMQDRLFITNLLVPNIHCDSCVAYVQEILPKPPQGGIKGVYINVPTQRVCLVHTAELHIANMKQILRNSAFEVSFSITHLAPSDCMANFPASVFNSNPIPTEVEDIDDSATPEQQERHMEYCDACKQHHPISSPARETVSEFDGAAAKSGSTTLSRTGTLSRQTDDKTFVVDIGDAQLQEETELFAASLSIEGMTCASCSNGITNALKDMPLVRSVEVNLANNSAAVLFRGPESNVDEIISEIEDLGYDAAVVDIAAKAPPNLNRQATKPEAALLYLTLSIEGMTCGSCVGTVTRGLNELSFVKEVAIDLVGNSGKVLIQGEENVDAVLEKIDDLGYDATIITRESVSQEQESTSSRTIMLAIDGMYCDHCPQRIVDALRELGSTSLVVDKAPTIKRPVMTITYTPKLPDFTARKLVTVVSAQGEQFKVSVYHPPSLEERSQAMQQSERKRILYRLLFSFLAAIPTFLLGVVYMSLVPSSNSVRMYMMESAWAGRAARVDWALFIIATPVMFFAADVFHRRAGKEIYALWRPGSKVPLYRRFVRFGSMNLLISAGTMVAYWASLGILVANATSSSSMKTGKTTTYFDSVVFLTFFILGGRYLEARSKAKTGDAVSMLGKLRPSEALLIFDAATDQSSGFDAENLSIEKIDPDLLEIGDRVKVPHGASPPADGIVIEGGPYQFDESSLTGESKPVNKHPGDTVVAGSVNTGHAVDIKISAIGGSSMLEQIVSVVREGQTRRAPIEKIADRLTGYFVPVITLLAILTFVVWFSLGQSGVLPASYLDVEEGGWAFWAVQFAIAVFVVACPCGIGLAAPTALYVGGKLAAKEGILVRGGGEAFEEASKLDAIVFDKTGTLTQGDSFEVEHDHVEGDDPVHWALARALEESSTHPIAQAIAKHCPPSTDVRIVKSNIQEHPGYGMRGSFDISISGQEVQHYEAAIGSERFARNQLKQSDDLEKNGTTALERVLLDKRQAGKSIAVLMVSPAGTELGRQPELHPAIVFSMHDPLRLSARPLVAALQSRNIAVYICTGDNISTAAAVASQLNIPISNVRAGLLPAEKADFIRDLQDPKTLLTLSNGKTKSKRNGQVRNVIGFLGDGTNDTPALTASTVSITHAAGTSIAMNSASFIIMSASKKPGASSSSSADIDLLSVLTLLHLSRRVLNRVRVNFLWALVYNIALIPLAMGVFYPINGKKTRLDPVWASLAMAGSSVSVVCSSLALGWGGTNGIRAWVRNLGKKQHQKESQHV